jgi:hypothetical protein
MAPKGSAGKAARTNAVMRSSIKAANRSTAPARGTRSTAARSTGTRTARTTGTRTPAARGTARVTGTRSARAARTAAPTGVVAGAVAGTRPVALTEPDRGARTPNANTNGNARTERNAPTVIADAAAERALRGVGQPANPDVPNTREGWQDDGTILTPGGAVFDPRGYHPTPKTDAAGHALSGPDSHYVDELLVKGMPPKIERLTA